MDPSNVSPWVELIGGGGLPVVLGWLAFSASRIVTRWAKHMDRQEEIWHRDDQHRVRTVAHMESEERYLRVIAERLEAPAKSALGG